MFSLHLLKIHLTFSTFVEVVGSLYLEVFTQGFVTDYNMCCAFLSKNIVLKFWNVMMRSWGACDEGRVNWDRLDEAGWGPDYGSLGE